MFFATNAHYSVNPSGDIEKAAAYICKTTDMQDRIDQLRIFLPSKDIRSLGEIAEQGCKGPTTLLIKYFIGHTYPTYEIAEDAREKADNICKIGAARDRIDQLKILLPSENIQSLRKMVKEGCKGPTKFLKNEIAIALPDTAEKLTVSMSPPILRPYFKLLALDFVELTGVCIVFTAVTMLINISIASLWRKVKSSLGSVVRR